MFVMTSSINLLDISVVNSIELERISLLTIDAIDDLEQLARARELTNIIWDINENNGETVGDWQKTEVLLESYEKARDESLNSALSNLRELIKIVNESSLRDRSHSL